MKVCHITSVHKSTDVRIFEKECVSLAAAGYDVYLVAQGESREEKGVHVTGVGEAPASRIKRMTIFARKVYKKALELDADIYHFHDPELLPYGVKLKKRGKKVIFDSHENILHQMLEKTYIPSCLRVPIDKIFRRYVKNAVKKIDCIITVTPHIVEAFEKIHPNVREITNYPAFYESDINPMDKYRQFSLCSTGGIDMQWNHHNIINAISDLNVTYILCGKGDLDYIKQLENLENWHKVNFRGQVPYSESLQIQRKSHLGMALLQPGRNTGGNIGTLGNTKLFEYMMAGIPVICTHFELWHNIIDNCHCGICVNPENLEEISQAIKFLSEHPDEAARMGQNGRKAVKTEFNWSTQEKKLLDLYTTILK